MGAINKQPNGRWRARYRDPGGRTRSMTFDRKGDAERFLQKNGTAIQHGDWIDPSMRRTSFGEWAELWWQTTVRLRPTTRRGYWQVLHNHVLPYFARYALAELVYMDIEQFIAFKLNEGRLGPKKIRDCVSVVSLIMQAAIKSGARRDNPAAGHHITVRRRRIRQGDVLDMEQIHALIDHVKDPYKPAVWLLVLTGIRPAELCGLRVRSVDFARHQVKITETLLPVSAYGNEHLQLVEGPPKTDAGDRAIPIPAWLCEQIAEGLTERAKRRGGPIRTDEPMFVNRVGKPLNRDKFRETVIHPAIMAAGLPAQLRTYDLRHSHASILIDLGANVLAVAQRMGHSDPTVTLREYGHLFEGVQERLSEQLDQLRATTAAATEGDVINLPVAEPQDTPRTREDTKPGLRRSIAGSDGPQKTWRDQVLCPPSRARTRGSARVRFPPPPLVKMASEQEKRRLRNPSKRGEDATGRGVAWSEVVVNGPSLAVSDCRGSPQPQGVFAAGLHAPTVVSTDSGHKSNLLPAGSQGG